MDAIGAAMFGEVLLADRFGFLAALPGGPADVHRAPVRTRPSNAPAASSHEVVLVPVTTVKAEGSTSVWLLAATLIRAVGES
jgi:hypothetical protein